MGFDDVFVGGVEVTFTSVVDRSFVTLYDERGGDTIVCIAREVISISHERSGLIIKVRHLPHFKERVAGSLASIQEIVVYLTRELDFQRLENTG